MSQNGCAARRYKTLSSRSSSLLLLEVICHPSDEQRGVQVEAVCPMGTFALDVRLAIHAEHADPPAACHHQLVPATLADLDFTDHGACS